MAKPAIGISENIFDVGVENTFKINGADLEPDVGEPDPVVVLSSTAFDWGPVTLENKNKKYLLISATPTAKTTAKKAKTTTDDITVTITFNEGLGTEFDVSITCEDVDYV